MLREYAVDPRAIYRNVDSFQRFLVDFNAENGRLVSAVPKRWYEVQQRELKGLGLKSVARSKALGKLKTIRDISLVNGYTIPSELSDWMSQALHVKQGNDINAIMSNRFCIINQIYNYENLLEVEPLNWTIENTSLVQRQASIMADEIAHSLKRARVVFYIDPYFNPDESRFYNPLMAFINKMMLGSSRSITIHTSEEKTLRASLKKSLEQVVKPALPDGFKVKLFIWPKTQMHDRYILTKNVGYSFGHGLDEGQFYDALEVNIHRLGESSRSELFKRFSQKDDINDNAIIVTGE